MLLALNAGKAGGEAMVRSSCVDDKMGKLIKDGGVSDRRTDREGCGDGRDANAGAGAGVRWW